HYWMQATGKEKDPEEYEAISKHVKKVNVEAKALLGETSIKMQQLLNLKKGDIVTLDQSIDQPLRLVINNEPKMYVQPGKVKNRVAVQIIDEIKGGNEQ